MRDTALPIFSGASRGPWNRGVIFFTGVALALIAIFWIYRLGFSAPWTFDDRHSLAGLEQVNDFGSAATFTFGNRTGPTGRPLSMVTFLGNLGDWDENPAGFRRINLFIHLLNVALVMAVAWLTARNVPSLSDKAPSLAAALALVWGLHPLLASTVLSIVQRMALLSAFFVLLGVLGYLVGRERLPEQPAKGIAIILLSLLVCTSLGAFSKENALLLPSFVGLLELTILSRYRPIRLPHWNPLGYLLLWGPILVFAAYVAYRWPVISAAQVEAYRAFDWSQRLWSEMLILWEYSRQVFVPDIRLLGPMQDDTTRLHGLDLLTFTATLSWIGALGVSFLFRKRYPIFLFGIGLFLIAHLIESTFVQLELYFEHRNYIASLGLLAIPITLAWQSEKPWPRFAVWFGAIPTLALLLFVTARGWGDPVLSSERWYQAHPTSLRAIQRKVRIMERFEGLPATAGFLALASDEQPSNLSVAALALSFQCKANDRIEGPTLLNRIQRLIEKPHPLKGALGFLGFIEETLLERNAGKCPWLENDRLVEILQRIADDPSLSSHPSDLARYHLDMGILQLASGNSAEAIDSLHRGFLLDRNHQAFALYTGVLRGLGLTTEAEKIRDEFLAHPPRDIFSLEEHRRRVREAYAAAPVRLIQGSSVKPPSLDGAPRELPPLGTEPEPVDRPATEVEEPAPNPPEGPNRR